MIRTKLLSQTGMRSVGLLSVSRQIKTLVSAKHLFMRSQPLSKKLSLVPQESSFSHCSDRFLVKLPSNTNFACLSTQPFSDSSGSDNENTSEEEISEFLAKNDISVSDRTAPKPVMTFEGLEDSMPEEVLQKVCNEFDGPTPIQAQGLPIALSGRNMVGIGQTGSGKTLVYLLPAFAHIEKLRQQGQRSGGPPVALVIAPTRELAQQIEEVARNYRRASQVRTVCCIGGENRGRQLRQYDTNPQLIIATPGRLNDFLEAGDMSVSDVSYVVLDEADRMLDMGFEPQIRAILESVKPEKQILMFSATWPEEVRDLSNEFLGQFTFMKIGSTELHANKNIEQQVEVCQTDYKQEAFLNKIDEIGHDKVLVFTERKLTVDRLERILRNRRIRVMGIHGDKSQRERSSVIQRFRDGSCKVMIATDVAARGLDISDVQYVVNYDFPTDIENYVHRIGRTGRVDKKGTSISYMTPDDARFAPQLIEILKESNQEINPDLHELVRYARQNKAEKTRQKKYDRGMKRDRYGGFGGSSSRYRGLRDEDDYGGYRQRRQNYGDEDEDDYGGSRQRRGNDGGYRQRRRYDDEDGGYRQRSQFDRPQRRDDNQTRVKGEPRGMTDWDDWERKHRGPSID